MLKAKDLLPRHDPAIRIPVNPGDWQAQHLAFAEDVIRIIHRTNLFGSTKNPKYAAEIWLLCRKCNVIPSEDVLVVIDMAASSGTFFNVGKNASKDIIKQRRHSQEMHRDLVDLRFYAEAARLHKKNPTMSQNAIALELKTDPHDASIRTRRAAALLGGAPPWAMEKKGTISQ